MAQRRRKKRNWLAGAVAATTTFVTISEILVKWFKL
jgi:hypothetical protein